ncbi:MAG: urease accessory protein UreF [Alphaproteobacteria bacterium]|nr:urease accessory protein UreF [Alphaproteobacteria bacterium]
MDIEASQLLLLLNWMSPAFPIGNFAYSHGLEWAIAKGHITTQGDVESWIGNLITSGSGWNDAVLFALVWKEDSHELNELALALAASAERYLESTQLGRSFAIAAASFIQIDRFTDEIAYPIAAALACRDVGMNPETALLAYLQSFASALVSVAVRLVPLGQTAGLTTLKNLMPIIATTATRASSATRDDLGSTTLLADVASMKHETLQPRIFRT